MIGYVHIELRMAGAVGGPGTDYRDRYSPRVRRRVKGKQVKVLCDLVTVSSSVLPDMSLRNREGGSIRYAVSQETCRLWYGDFEFQITRFDCTEKTVFDNPTASMRWIYFFRIVFYLISDKLQI